MKKTLHFLFNTVLTLFAFTNMSGQMLLNINKTNIGCSGSATGSITVIVDPFLMIGMPPYTYTWSNGATGNTITNLSEGTYSVNVKDQIGLITTASVDIAQYKAICVQTNASCTGAASGSATVAVKGGSGNYGYSWNSIPVQTTQSVSGLTAGTYTVTVTDNVSGCITTGSVTIELAPSLSVGDPTVYGNNSWNVYAWNQGTFNNLPWSSEYSGYFTTNTLNFNSEDYFEDYSTPSFAPGYQGCPVNGDNHSWSAKRQGFPCGFYKIDLPMHDDWVRLYIDDQLVFSDNNCCESHINVWQGYLNNNSKVEFRIAETAGQSRGNIKFNLIEPTAVITNTTCYGGNNGAIDITPVLNSDCTYDWGNGITTEDRTGLVAGDYTVAITNPSGCIETKNFTITQPSAIDLNVTLAGNTLTANQSGATYQWIQCPATILIGENGQSFTPPAIGSYAVVVTDGLCSVVSLCVPVTTLATPDFEEKSKFVIHPNPSQGIITIASDSDGDYQVINELGQNLKTFKIEANTSNTINLQHLNEGLYFIKGMNDTKSKSYKLLIKK